MPIYEYYCKECDSRFEKICSAKNADTMNCEKCASPKTIRLLSPFGITRGTHSSSECDYSQTSGSCNQGHCPCGL